LLRQEKRQRFFPPATMAPASTRQIEPNATAIPHRWSASIGGSFLMGSALFTGRRRSVLDTRHARGMTVVSQTRQR